MEGAGRAGQDRKRVSDTGWARRLQDLFLPLSSTCLTSVKELEANARRE